MKVDYLSDLHIDFYFSKKNRIKDEDIYRLYHPIITKDNREIADVLIVAGDLRHYNWQNIHILRYLKQYYYKYIICVLGNHDYYIIDHDATLQFKDSFERVKKMRELINQESNMYCLDGNIIEIDGVKFGGCDSWYNDGYFARQYPNEVFNKKETNRQWHKTMNDAKYIYGVTYYDNIWEKEKLKIENIYNKCDVIITHINPSCKDEHINIRFQDNPANIFFSFEGEKYLKQGNMKYWIFGHTHEELKYEEHGVSCHCNPLGYPNENGYGKWVEMHSFEI